MGAGIAQVSVDKVFTTIMKDMSYFIMTTEILHSMFYNGSDVIRDLE